MTASSYFTYTALGGSLAILAALLLGLNRALAHAGLPALERASISQKSAAARVRSRWSRATLPRVRLPK